MTDRDGPLSSLSLPACTPIESCILRSLVTLADEYLLRKAQKLSYNPPPNTKTITDLLKIRHRDSLSLLNRLERRGLVQKERQLSAGSTGRGYDGSLHSSVMPTATARVLVSKNP